MSASGYNSEPNRETGVAPSITPNPGNRGGVVRATVVPQRGKIIKKIVADWTGHASPRPASK